MIVEPEQPRIAVSLEALSQLPAPSPVAADHNTTAEAASTQTSPTAEQSRLQQELQSTKDVVVKQAEELQKLKAELESVRRQLAEKDVAASKAKPKAAPRKPTATP
jgi:molecular chaperone GrpE (heat shock protein)